MVGPRGPGQHRRAALATVLIRPTRAAARRKRLGSRGGLSGALPHHAHPAADAGEHRSRRRCAGVALRATPLPRRRRHARCPAFARRRPRTAGGACGAARRGDRRMQERRGRVRATHASLPRRERRCMRASRDGRHRDLRRDRERRDAPQPLCGRARSRCAESLRSVARTRSEARRGRHATAHACRECARACRALRTSVARVRMHGVAA